ncbi:MAG TPA: aminotransferase class IV [Solirubrobacterales bacterium]|nr:aminotransferase class IV [Solirubrobacterales bacterium]
MRVSLTPDPQRGVFETMLVLDGRPVELDAHLERLADSLMVLYGEDLPSEAANQVREGAGDLEQGKLRIAITPSLDGARLAMRVVTARVDPAAVFPGPARGIVLHSFSLEGGLGEHKWADRRLLERAESGLAPGELALLVDADGAALEASRASLFAVGDDWLATPPADGRILPGIARRRTIETARDAGIEVREESLSLASLGDYEVILAGSVRGIEPVLALDDVALRPPGALSARLVAGLRRRWLPAAQAESAAVRAGGRRVGPPAR